MAAFVRTPFSLREIDRFYPRYRDIREAQGPIDALDLLWWPAEDDGRQLVWQARGGMIGPVYPPWDDSAYPMTLHYRRLCVLQDQDRPEGLPPRNPAHLSITGTHSAAWPGPLKVTEDVLMWRKPAVTTPNALVYMSPADTLRAVATFDTTLSPTRYRFDYFFGQPTPIIYTVVSATGAWATATNLVVVYDSGDMREVAVMRGNRE